MLIATAVGQPTLCLPPLSQYVWMFRILVQRLYHVLNTNITRLWSCTVLLKGVHALESSYCGSVGRYGGAIVGIQVCLTSAACVPSQAECSSFMSLVHCNSVYWTITADICHIQTCKTQVGQPEKAQV